LVLGYKSHTSFGTQLGFIRRLDALDARGIYSEAGHPASEEVHVQN